MQKKSTRQNKPGQQKTYAVILAAGKGERTNWDIPKQFMKVSGKTLLEHITDIYERSRYIDEIIIVTHADYRKSTEEIVYRNQYRKVRKILTGGETRRESSAIGVYAIPDDNDAVLIQDAVMPFVSDAIIENCLQALQQYDAVDVAIPTVDTIIRVDHDMLIKEIPDREYILRGLTPQVFRVGILKRAHQLASQDTDVKVTDDCGLILRYCLSKVFVVLGDKTSIKVTYPEDVYLAEKLFQLKSRTARRDIDLDLLKDQVIVIIGAGRGIGKNIQNVAETHGARVYGFSRRTGVNVSRIETLERVLRNIYSAEGKINHIIVTAAVLHRGSIMDRNLIELYDEVNTNYLGSINVIKAGAHYIKETKGSFLLFAGTSWTKGRPLYCIYSSTKAAIVNLVQGLSEEFFIDGIRINAMNPERVAGPMREENFGKEPSDMLVNPEKVAAASLKTLLSDFTGQLVDVRKIEINPL